MEIVTAPISVTTATLKPAPLFDALEAWHRLSAVEQQAIGVAAIISAIGYLGNDLPLEQQDGWNYEAAAGEASLRLEVAVVRAIAEDWQTLPRPSLAPLGVRFCQACGCTEDYACEDGCHWVGPQLCSSCARVFAE
jgi:hypothetical protein